MRLGRWLAWGLPIAAMLISGFLVPRFVPIAWPLALAWMGIACSLNAVRCGRMHCYFTAPFFLLLAAVSVLYGVGLLPLGGGGWDWIGGVAAVGGGLLTCLPEHIWGRYRTGSSC